MVIRYVEVIPVIAGKRKDDRIGSRDLALELQAVLHIPRTMEFMGGRYVVRREELGALSLQICRDLVVGLTLRKPAQHRFCRGCCNRLGASRAAPDSSRRNVRQVPIGEREIGLLENKTREVVGEEPDAAANHSLPVPPQIQVESDTRLYNCGLHLRNETALPRGDRRIVRRVKCGGGVREAAHIAAIAVVVTKRIAVAVDAQAKIQSQVWLHTPLILSVDAKVVDGAMNVAKSRKRLAE